MRARLRCPGCGAGLAPTWSGLKCPRFNACGRGGPVECGGTSVYLHLTSVSSGVKV